MPKLIRISAIEWVSVDKIVSVKVLPMEIWITTGTTVNIVEKGSGYYELTLQQLGINK